jgi:hypothetical protein
VRGTLDRAPPVFRHVAQTAKQISRSLLLLGREMVEYFHALEDALALLLRQAVELPQPLTQFVLIVGGKLLELRVAAKRAFLLRRRQVLVAP